MTVDAFVAAPDYTVAGTGPYAVPHDYMNAEELAVSVVRNDVETPLAYGADWTADPGGRASSGAVTLTASAAASWAGATLVIGRATRQEQGWAAQGGAREAGLEAQLDRIVQALQDQGARADDLVERINRTLRVPELDLVLPPLPVRSQRANRLMMWNGDGTAVEAYAGALQLTVTNEANVYPNRLAVAAASVGAQQVIRTVGYATPGDGGGATWIRVASDPGHAASVQSADGVWFAILDHELFLEQFGAVGDDVADDGPAFVAADAAAAALGGRQINGRPEKTYRVTAQPTLSGGRWIGNGATIHYVGPVNTAPLHFDELAAGVEVALWIGDFSAVNHHLVRGAKFRGVRVHSNQVKKGGIFEAYLAPSSAGATGASWDASQPDVSAIVFGDLSQNVEVFRNDAQGDGAAPDGGLNLGVIRLMYVVGAAAYSNRIRGYTGKTTGDVKVCHGIVWTGGDANPTRDGGVGSVRWARAIRIWGNEINGVSGGGIWGSQGRDVTVQTNAVTGCGDIGVHGEGTEGGVFSGNVCRNCKFGGLTPYFVEERTLYSGNVVVIDDAATWGTYLLLQKLFSDVSGFDVRIEGNLFFMADASAMGVLEMERGGGITFENNTIIDGRFDSEATNSGDRFVRHNRFLFTRDPGDHGLRVGLGRHPGEPDRDALVVVEGNTIRAIGWNGSGLQAAVYVHHSAGVGEEQTHALVRANAVYGWYDSAADRYKGFPADFLTQSALNVGVHATDFIDNGVWAGIIADVSHKPGVADASLNQRIMHRGTYSTRPALSYPYQSAPPTAGIYLNGSRGDYEQPAAGGFEGWIASGSARVNAPSSGAWSNITDYDEFTQIDVAGADVFIAVAKSGPGNGGAVNPATDDGSTWRRCAAIPRALKGRGAVEA